MRFEFADWESRQRSESALKGAWLATRDYAAQLKTAPPSADCRLCRTRALLQLHGDPHDADLREGLVCTGCGLNTRLRAALSLLQAHLAARRPPGLLARLRRQRPPHVYVTEQATATYVWMQQHLAIRLHGGEYEPDHQRRHALTGYLRQIGGRGRVFYRDLTALDFPDASLEAVASFDVLEHVPDYRAALREMARVLRPDGACIATFPFTDRPETVVRARVSASGEIEHLQPPEYHGDPISGGILCYYHFGWDVLAAFREAGFRQARMVMPYALEQGLPYGMWTLVAIR